MKEDIKYILEYFSIEHREYYDQHYGCVLIMNKRERFPLWRECWTAGQFVSAGTDLLQDMYACLTLS
jgi:hypothetical protein